MAAFERLPAEVRLRILSFLLEPQGDGEHSAATAALLAADVVPALRTVLWDGTLVGQSGERDDASDTGVSLTKAGLRRDGGTGGKGHGSGARWRSIAGSRTARCGMSHGGRWGASARSCYEKPARRWGPASSKPRRWTACFGARKVRRGHRGPRSARPQAHVAWPARIDLECAPVPSAVNALTGLQALDFPHGSFLTTDSTLVAVAKSGCQLERVGR